MKRFLTTMSIAAVFLIPGFIAPVIFGSSASNCWADECDDLQEAYDEAQSLLFEAWDTSNAANQVLIDAIYDRFDAYADGDPEWIEAAETAYDEANEAVDAADDAVEDATQAKDDA